jgi:dUTP pyrophosphatase
MIPIKILNTSKNPTPKFQTEEAAGFDLAITETAVIPIGTTRLFGTGIHVIIPHGYEGQLRLRSSMCKRGVVIPNAPGTIDSDYRGEIKIALTCISRGDAVVQEGERVAQLVISKLPEAILREVTEEDFYKEETSRGSGGFGSTGSGINMTGL